MVSKAKRHPRNQYALQSAQSFAYTAPPMVPPAPPSASRSANFTVLHDKNASVANVEFSKRDWADYYNPAYEFKASGSAKREQGDVYDEEIGELIAAARAFQDLSRQLMSEASKRVSASTAAQRERQRRAQEKKAARARPVKHRTLKEWEQMQKELTFVHYFPGKSWPEPGDDA